VRFGVKLETMIKSVPVKTVPVNRRRRSFADEIYDEMRRMIVTLEVQPGELLLEKELSSRFAVSRTPVREATLRLFEHGLVEIAPQHATFVAGINPDAVRQAQFLRENLEAPVVRRLCAGGPIDLARQRALVDEHRIILDRADYAASVPVDDRFHESLFGAAGMGPLWGVIQARKAHLDRIRFLQTPEPGKLQLIVEQHEEILAAIEAQDPDCGERAVRSHVSQVLLALDRLLAERPELSAQRASRRSRTRHATVAS